MNRRIDLLKDAQYFEECLELTGGDVCIFVTDGITEAFDDALLHFRDVLAATVRENSRSATGICDAIMARAVAGHGPHGVDDWTDDRTVVIVAVGNGHGA